MLSRYAFSLRNSVRRVLGLAVLTALLTATLPALSTSAMIPGKPTIAFLNPSGFASTGTVLFVGNGRVGPADAADETYRISAWVGNIDTDVAFVEFELLREGRALLTLDGFQSHPDTFESEIKFPEITAIPDGNYMLRATLYAAAEQAATTSQPVVVSRAVDRAELTYPAGAGGSHLVGSRDFGTFAGLSATPTATDSRPNGVVEARTGPTTTWLRAFYTTSRPGSSPNWVGCGTEKMPAHPSPGAGAAVDGVRCELQARRLQSAVTAVAIVANSSRGDYDVSLNGVGDATRVVDPYAQVPVYFDFLEGGTDTVVAVGADSRYPCHEVVVQVQDQYQRPIAGANIDVHAWGPGDGLRFDTGLTPPAPNQVPNRSPHGSEPGIDCLLRSHDTAGAQGVHNLVGASNLKHIESAAVGTDDEGRWAFAVDPVTTEVNPSTFTTRYVLWVDELDTGNRADTDTVEQTEIVRCGSVGFGGPPEPPQGQPVVADEACFAPPPTVNEPTPTNSPAPGPTPTPPPTEGPMPRTSRSIVLRSGASLVERGDPVRLRGAISSSSPECVRAQLVRLMRIDSAGAERRLARIRSKTNGGFAFTVRVRAVTKYRAIAPRTSSCLAAKSNRVRVRVK